MYSSFNSFVKLSNAGDVAKEVNRIRKETDELIEKDRLEHEKKMAYIQELGELVRQNATSPDLMAKVNEFRAQHGEAPISK